LRVSINITWQTLAVNGLGLNSRGFVFSHPTAARANLFNAEQVFPPVFTFHSVLKLTINDGYILMMCIDTDLDCDAIAMGL